MIQIYISIRDKKIDGNTRSHVYDTYLSMIHVLCRKYVYIHIYMKKQITPRKKSPLPRKFAIFHIKTPLFLVEKIFLPLETSRLRKTLVRRPASPVIYFFSSPRARSRPPPKIRAARGRGLCGKRRAVGIRGFLLRIRKKPYARRRRNFFGIVRTRAPAPIWEGGGGTRAPAGIKKKNNHIR